ncbi:DNA helicase II [Corynebacterium phocae]|uniref:DNA 3'-5' helicase n=1 Tax=Corynebacterium phocae TaxID=161895 RepID=A0A1L7D4V4_9CORY|nr:UvrD-helicase domain-containing protein [Corynebacterium phocae]APT93071.1 DNA helicase II [Corynebacterium phocae]KAA8722372.1 ATP-dependent helicase [Corynebacterium phocae]
MFSPNQLANALGKKFGPTPEQAKVIEGQLGPKLVVAGAGAGKTETMASRVVYLVANGLVRPEQVLGLTFTRKAAQQLEQRIRSQLLTLKGSRLITPGSPAWEALENVAVNVSTYDSYAGDLVREYGLLLPVEPSSRLITAAEQYAIADEVVRNYDGELTATNNVDKIVQTVSKLSASMDNELTDPASIAEHEREFRTELASLEKTRANGPEYSQDLQKYLDLQKLRVQFLPLLSALAERQRELGVKTFGQQMAAAAKLAAQHPEVGKSQRARYRVVMLDEYQDTSHSQRVLLRALFGGGYHEGISVTAVGDPMQAIYGWRGATTENLASFVEDFPQANGEPAPKDQLTTSWRNPPNVLGLANRVADKVFGGNPRPVDPLSARPGANPGEIKLAYFATAGQECEFVAQHLAGKFRESQDKGQPFSAAVLVRANKHAPEIARALDAAGVPNEIVGLGGLLLKPEVQDLLALATMLVKPQDAAAALRILTGPIVGLGIDDLMALHERVRNLQGASGGRVLPDPDQDPVEYLQEELHALAEEGADFSPGLGDAVADLGEPDRYSPEGLARIRTLASKLRGLRTHSLSKSLNDIFADIEEEFGIRTEALANPSGAGTAHLDQFADIVAGYPGSGLAGLIDYLQLAREQEDGLAPGEVVSREDRVMIMTAHKAKGLEFGHVCVLHADSTTYNAKAETFLTKLEKVPGDQDVIDAADAVKRSDFNNACKAFIAESREHQAEESARLFYVAITRTEESLTVTGSGTNNARGKSKKGPYELLETLRAAYPDLVVHWEVPEAPVPEQDQEAISAVFPALAPTPEIRRGADVVLAALNETPEPVAGELFELWERDATALIEEWNNRETPVVDVELPAELTASDMVALSTDREEFAKRKRRPVPFKPNSFAKRGTAFHAWVEEFFHGESLLSEDELPGMGEVASAEQLEVLREKFAQSSWAQRTPYAVEAPFEVSIGSVVVRGRMDAVFQEPDGSFMVVDWKTGRRPTGRDMDNAAIQLAVYAQAWQRTSGTDQPVRAAFYYVEEDFTFIPEHLPDRAELEEILKFPKTTAKG